MSRPRRLEPEPPPIFHSYQQTPGTSSNGVSVLAAEDDQALAEALVRSLHASGAVFDHAATGSKADATLIAHSEFDLLILDLRSATTHSLEMLKLLHARGSHLPVLVLTGQTAWRSNPFPRNAKVRCASLNQAVLPEQNDPRYPCPWLFLEPTVQSRSDVRVPSFTHRGHLTDAEACVTQVAYRQY